MNTPRVWIGGWRQVEHLDPTKAHTVYQVEVTTSSGSYTRVERRYSAFLSLHKDCRKYYCTEPFPPKRIRNTTARVLESRRAGLEHYIQSLAKLRPTPPQLAAFLQLPSLGDSDQADYHATVIGFIKDPYLEDTPPILEDMITQASVCAFYDS
ncbi:sorting nexin-22-like [Eurytemora carolleeae]|uniref:sorting nexin-22-like n=1 Tax=Eurytemora carolleeae TaxID=1294199 RepID=UPI000C7648F7|nr:sorting nexin-22-like [Eurytemora carolleeae]|eukprot:XP_023331722.1 sorting nexin-22-like [Eurytemora affinis]